MSRDTPRVLVEMSVVEQRYRAVLEVLAGSSKSAVAERFGVSRQAVHRWLGWYAVLGLAGLVDRSHRPRSHPAQTPAVVEAAVCELRAAHPRWGPRRLEFELGTRGCPGPVPSRSTIYRVLVRQGLVDRGAAGPEPGELPPVAAGHVHAAVAAGHRRRHVPLRRRRVQGRHRRR